MKQQLADTEEKAKRDLQALKDRCDQAQKEALDIQKNKHDRELGELNKKNVAKLQEMEDKFKKIIKQLEADLEVARSGFENERAVLEKRRADM